jgi:hypothetical protein
MFRSKSPLLVVAALFPCVASAQKVDVEGRAWLAQYTDAAQVNVNGTWNGGSWGKVVLQQAEGSREVAGRGDGWTINGVVSGQKVYLLFSHKGRVNYCAELDGATPGALTGGYSTGMMKPKSKLRRMDLKK